MIETLLTYDPDSGVLTWLPRTPEMFEAKNPKRACATWNTRYAGQRMMTHDEVLAIVTSIEFRRFHNGIRILRSITLEEAAAGGVEFSSIRERDGFVGSKEVAFIIRDDATKAALWKLIEAQQPDALKAGVTHEQT